MNDVIHWYYKNRKKFWGTIGIIAITIIVIQLINKICYIDQNNKITNGEIFQNSKQETYNSIVLEEDKSTVSGDSISRKQKDLLKTIDQFINYCNEGKIEDAYSLLSDECKKQMYPTVEQFKTVYYQKIFNGKLKSTSVENWIDNIYKVNIIDDPLSTGIYNSQNNIQDYITIVEDDEKNIRLNINNYIGKKKIDIEKEENDIKIKVLEKHVYKDSEIYTFEITNNSDKVILLDDCNYLETMYIEDKNDIKYSAYTHELTEAELKLASGETRSVSIKYFNQYGSGKKINNIVFSRVILDYYAYTNYKKINMGYYNDYAEIQIKL